MRNSHLSTSPYQMAINNVARRIQSSENRALADADKPCLDAFTAATVLSAAFCKDQNEVLHDLVRTTF